MQAIEVASQLFLHHPEDLKSPPVRPFLSVLQMEIKQISLISLSGARAATSISKQYDQFALVLSFMRSPRDHSRSTTW